MCNKYYLLFSRKLDTTPHAEHCKQNRNQTKVILQRKVPHKKTILDVLEKEDKHGKRERVKNDCFFHGIKIRGIGENRLAIYI